MANTTSGAERKRRTPAEIASADLAKAEERVARATKRFEKANEEVSAASEEVTRAKRFRDYAASNPDLPDDQKSDEPTPA